MTYSNWHDSFTYIYVSIEKNGFTFNQLTYFKGLIMQTFKVLSIDAWGNADEGYEWNQWFNAGHIDIDVNADHQTILQAMQTEGFINYPEFGDIEDDGFNLVIVDKQTRQPFFAIEYGSTI
jgi:hypothetical protein